MVEYQQSPSDGATVRQYQLSDDGTFPNSRLPLLVYPLVVDSDVMDSALAFEQQFTANGWPAAWRNGIYEFHHYHSMAHEVLGICRGQARVQMGGPSGPILNVTTGTAVVIPAGVAHRSLETSADFLVVGAYPAGQQWDMNHGRPGERPGTDANIRSLPLPAADPLMGMRGPLTQLWS